MTTEELHEKINLGENVHVEFKSTKTSRDYIIFDVGIELKQQIKKEWLVSEGKSHGIEYRLKRNILQGGQARGQAGGQVKFEGAKLGAKLITNLTQTSVSPYLGGLSHKIYKREPSLPTSPNQEYSLTELYKITLEGMNKI